MRVCVRADSPTAHRPFQGYCREECAPRLTVRAAQALRDHYVRMRTDVREMEEKGDAPSIPITVRQLEAIV